MDPRLTVAIFALGLAFGSFLNVCIYRLPRVISVIHPRSSCPQCRALIPFYDNIPVMSWLILRGRCRHCRHAISPRYFIVELLTAALFLLCYAQFGFTLSAVKCSVFGFLLLGLIFTDAETQLLPDKLTLPGLIIGLAFSLAVPVNDVVSQFLPVLSSPASATSWRLLSFLDAVSGAAVGASVLYGAGVLYLRARGVEGMGFGDVKLMAMVGAFVGVRLTIFTIFAASFAGSLFGLWTLLSIWVKRTRRRILRHHESGREARRRAWASASVALRHLPIPFGVFLGSMAMVAFLYGNRFLRLYWRWF